VLAMVCAGVEVGLGWNELKKEKGESRMVSDGSDVRESGVWYFISSGRPGAVGSSARRVG
jgi:hypothetical protein